MRTREGIEKDIQTQKKMIELEKRFNEDSGELSFLYHQLDELEKELREYDEKNK